MNCPPGLAVILCEACLCEQAFFGMACWHFFKGRSELFLFGFFMFVCYWFEGSEINTFQIDALFLKGFGRGNCMPWLGG
jgi:hypothetical protein